MRNLDYSYLRVFPQDHPFFHPQGFQEITPKFFFIFFQEVMPESLVTSPLWHGKFRSMKVPGFFLKIPLFSPPGFSQNHQRFFFTFLKQVLAENVVLFPNSVSMHQFILLICSVSSVNSFCQFFLLALLIYSVSLFCQFC